MVFESPSGEKLDKLSDREHRERDFLLLKDDIGHQRFINDQARCHYVSFQ